MRIRFVSRLLAVVGFFAAAGAADAQSGTITGRVTAEDGGAAVAGARVQALVGAGAVQSAVTGADGSYRLIVPAGTYVVVAQNIGYSQRRREGVVVTAGTSVTVDFALAQVAATLNPIVQTAVRGVGGEKLLESPNAISMIASERIAERPAVTVTDHLKNQPGLAISNGGIVQANIVSRGFNNAFSTSMLMLQDYRFAGVPSLRVNVPFLFTGTGEDIDRIEVLQGPASALYGPNSGAGVLHVLTKSPFDSRGTSVTLDGGQRSLFRIAGRHAQQINDQFAFKVSGEYMRANDWEYNDPNEIGDATASTAAGVPTYSATDTRLPASRRNTPVTRDFGLERYSTEARLDYRPNEDTEAITTFGYTMAGSALEITTTFGAAQVKNWSYTNFQQRFRHKDFFAQVFYNSSNSGNDNALDDQGTYYLRSGIPVVDQSSVLVAQAQQAYTLGSTKLVAGVDYIATTPETKGTIMGRNEDDDNIREMGAYLQFTQPLTPKLDLMGAVRGDMNSRIEGSQFSPRAALLYKAAANHNFRFTFNRAFNSPASFSFFLDQWSGNMAAQIPVQIMGNPPKEGWNYDRSCTSAVQSGICMRSPYQASGAPVDAAAAPGFNNFAQVLLPIIQGTPTSAAFSATAKAQLIGLMSGDVGNIIRTLNPSAAQAPAFLLNLNTRTPTSTAAALDLAPLGANFSNTWEIGYKGIIGERLRVSADYWYQIRPAEPTTQIVNPSVHFAAAALGPYLQAQLAAQLQLAPYNYPAPVATATAAAAGPAIAAFIQNIPQGALTFNNPNINQPFFVFTYQNATGHVDVRGIDLAVDYLLDGGWSVEATYSNMNRNLWTDARGSSPTNPLSANAPRQRGTLTVRRSDEARNMSYEVRGRYMDAFDVNSGVFNNFNIATGSVVMYNRVPVNAFIDAGFSWKLPVAQNIRWSLNVQNLLGNEVPSFIGVPAVGRFVTTRVAYNF